MLIPAFLATVLATTSVSVSAQQVGGDGCLRLLGSVACPGFSFAYLSPGNLSNAFPFFSEVTDVKSFDAAALNYFSNPFQWEATKFENQLGCSNASDAVLRFQRTVLCSNWVNSVWSKACLELYNGTSAATSQKMVCQSTCLDFAESENQLVNNTVADFCPGPDLTNGGRAAQLNKDFVDCTNWTTLATNNSDSCISGYDNGENNCGYGSSTAQLCGHCSGDQPDECCYSSNTDISVCGFALAPRPSSSASSSSAAPSGSSTAEAGNNNNGSSTLSGGKLAGTIVGSVLGGLLLLALLALLLLCLRKRRRQKDANNRDSHSSFAAEQTGDRGVFGSIFPNRNSTQPNAANSSEKGLLKHGGPAAASTPTMGGDTLYSGNKSTDGHVGAMAAAAGAGAGAGGASVISRRSVLGSPAPITDEGPGMRHGGTVLPKVRDENQSGDHWIETGAEVNVLWPYEAVLPDEIDLRPGMKLKMLRLFDDAWGVGIIVGGASGGEMGKQGVVPLVCVSEGTSFGSSPSGSASEGSGH